MLLKRSHIFIYPVHTVVEHEPIVNLTLQIHYLSDEAYLSIIYDHYLFDVPKLMDLCVLYGRANQAALGTMLTSIFERQPKYIEDLANAAKGLVQVSKLSHTHAVYMYGMCMTMRVCMCVRLVHLLASTDTHVCTQHVHACSKPNPMHIHVMYTHTDGVASQLYVWVVRKTI